MTVEAMAPAGARRHWSVTLLRGTGWTLITIGVLVLLFVVYELFGTDLVTNRHQDQLRQSLDRDISAGPGGRNLPPVPGGAVGYIRIPKIGLDMVFVEGVDTDDLKKGPGRYPETAVPGRRGNVAIAGHRTTYAKPFWSLNELDRGDRIALITREGRFVYEVAWIRAVSPSASEVLDRTRRPSLTLTTCEPRFSAAQRLIVRAVQIQGPNLDGSGPAAGGGDAPELVGPDG